jgi:hypothetical protein
MLVDRNRHKRQYPISETTHCEQGMSSMRSLVVFPSMILSLLACPPSKAADIYSCEAKEHLMLNDDGLVRAMPRMNANPQFMIDKNNGNAVGEIFLGSPKWKIVQEGSAANSLVSQGSVVSLMGPLAAYKIIVYSYQKGKEKPFVIEDHGGVGVFEIFSGICK